MTETGPDPEKEERPLPDPVPEEPDRPDEETSTVEEQSAQSFPASDPPAW